MGYNKKNDVDETQVDFHDKKYFRESRGTSEGFNIGHYINPPPILFTRDGHNIWDADKYRGSSAFLILSGPSFGEILKQNIIVNNNPMTGSEALSMPGFITMSTNNSIKSFRTNLWVNVDNPAHFMKSIWLDPKVTKYTPMFYTETNIFDNEKWEMTDIKVGDCPNVNYFKRNEKFQPEQFLTENTINWGNSEANGGGRSVMLAALKLLYYLGIRKVFLLGCDFSMSEKDKYHFDQDRTKDAIRGNNSTYEKLIKRFEILKPIFDESGLEIFNCNHDSNLKVFPYISFQDAFNSATEKMPKNWKEENSRGLYERDALMKERHKKIERNKEKEKKMIAAEEKEKICDFDYDPCYVPVCD